MWYKSIVISFNGIDEIPKHLQCWCRLSTFVAFWMNGSSVNLSPLKWSYFFLQRLHTEHDIWLFVGSLGSMDWLIWSSCRYLFNFSISFFWFLWKETDPTSEYRLQVEKIGKYGFELLLNGKGCKTLHRKSITIDEITISKMNLLL